MKIFILSDIKHFAGFYHLATAHVRLIYMGYKMRMTSITVNLSFKQNYFKTLLWQPERYRQLAKVSAAYNPHLPS